MQLLLVCCLAAAALAAEPSVWTWRCESGRCVRRSAADVTDGMQLNTCKLTCGELSAVWPRPTGPAAFGSSTVPFLLDNVQFQLVAPDPVKPMLQKATDIFLDNLRMMQPSAPGGRLPGCLRDGVCPKAVADQKVNVVVAVEADDTSLTLETSEDNQLVVSYTDGGDVNVVINATTFFGGRHGLETLSQLINYDDENASLQAGSGRSGLEMLHLTTRTRMVIC